MKPIIIKLYDLITSIWRPGKKFIEDHLEEVVDFIQRVKTVTDSPAADAITIWIPGEWDDVLLAKLRQALPIALEATGIITTCSPEENPRDYIECIVDEIRKIKSEQRAGLLRDLASNIAKAKAELEGDTPPATKQINLLLEMQYNKMTA